MRWRSGSVTPPVPSPRSPVTLFWPKSARDAKSMIGFFSRNWWPSTRESRAYARSAMRAASHRRLALVGIVVNEEVLGLDHLPVEVLVLDLVLTEVLLRAALEASAPLAIERDERRAP